jgi:hypothetical protein
MVSARRTDLKATFGSKRHELNVSTYQMVVLLLFNAADRLSYREIQAATAIAPADLQRSLQSLACVKARPPPPPPPPFPRGVPSWQIWRLRKAPLAPARRARRGLWRGPVAPRAPTP